MNRIDDFIKGKMEQRQFDFDETHWKQAAQMIDDQGKKRRKAFWIWFFTGQLLLWGVVFAFWQSGGSGSVSPAATTQAIAEQKDNRPELKSSGKNQEKPHDLTQQEQTNSNQGSPVTTSEKTKHHISNESPAKEVNNTITTIKNGKKNLSEPYDADQIITPSSTTPAQTKTTDENRMGTDFSQSQESPPAEQEMDSKILSVKSDFTQDFVMFLPGMNFNVQSNRNAWQGTISILEPAPLFKHQLSLFAASTLYPYVNSRGKSVIGYAAGLNYSGKIKRAWGFEAGIHYRMRQGTFLKALAAEQTSYAFSKSIARFFSMPEQIHSVEIPLSITFSKNRHTAAVGLNYSYLLGVQGTLTREGVGESFAGGQEIETLDHGWINVPGFKQTHWDVFGAWHFAVNTKMSLGVKVHYTFGGLTENQNSGIYMESKPVFFDVGIRYNLFNK